MTSAPAALTVTAADLTAGAHIVRVVKTPGRTRVFEADIDAAVIEVNVHPQYPTHMQVRLTGARTLNLELDRPVVIAAR